MNCPSRTDDTLLHDEWNQNPPLLAPDLTTRQDLNGTVNSCENKNDEKGAAGHDGGLDWGYDPHIEGSDTGKWKYPGGAGRGVSLTLSGTENMAMQWEGDF